MPEPHFGQVPVVIALETSRSEFLGQWAGWPNRMIEQKKTNQVGRRLVWTDRKSSGRDGGDRNWDLVVCDLDLLPRREPGATFES